jgi:hypothetical protein
LVSERKTTAGLRDRTKSLSSPTAEANPNPRQFSDRIFIAPCLAGSAEGSSNLLKT